MRPHVDLVIVFRAVNKSSPKQRALAEAAIAEKQYSLLLQTLRAAGLCAVGRRGERQGHLLVLLSCPLTQLAILMGKERHSDFLFGLPMSNSPTAANPQNLSTADRLRLIHGYVTCTPQDGGLGIVPGSTEWHLVESVMPLHDRHFNETWIHSWTTSQLASVKLGSIRDQFGDSVALYFSFLSSYTQALIVPSILGTLFYFFSTPYSPLYSTLLLIWSVGFVEFWRVREHILSLRWGTRGSFRVEKRRAQYAAGFPWWKREMRMLASIPIIFMFAAILAALLTAIFIFEAFVTHLYTGPGQKYISFSPTILFIALVPRVLTIYQASAKRFTSWENHAHQSTHDASLTLKTFALTAIVAYLGLTLSAFVYVPFGESIMYYVQAQLDQGFDIPIGRFMRFANGTASSSEKSHGNSTVVNGLWEISASNAKEKLNPLRLRDQMFAYTVTNQIIGTFIEIGLPFVLRIFSRGHANGGKGGKKRVLFEDEVGRGTGEKNSKEEREFLEIVRKEVALPEYELFGDYSEMVTQFGYVALWSTIWPLAPVMALVNNFLELRSDAFKITVHNRRPIPVRTDTIGPWLDALTFLTWLSALTNAVLVYLFQPVHYSQTQFAQRGQSPGAKGVVFTAVLIALAASHGYLLLRMVVRHIVERVVWKGSKEVEEWERSEREVKGKYLKSLEVEARGNLRPHVHSDATSDEDGGEKAFWEFDEGLEEIRRIGKHT